ncbi:hypothetical protein J7444_20050 [Labrenzia sp. R4_1]|uniref:hypothetical protein n=1 Tax=Labrenzia sp. R4_1 TaxID=2821106 RepID=UPI001ADB2DA1|nr:hypothetical protein [Labrenzia sp. R4_1]MBO9427039.1 hypothetical protein [Labrenzia sp. R4_1]
MSYGFIRGKRTLAVYANGEIGTGDKGSAGSKSWDVLVYDTFGDMFTHVAAGLLDAIALHTNPNDRNCSQNLLKLYGRQKNGRPILLSYSANKSDWFENLIYISGANIHLKYEPSRDEIIELIEKHIEERNIRN